MNKSLTAGDFELKQQVDRLKAVLWQDVVFGYDDAPILRPSAFSIEAGTFVGIMGPNGGGKTTLLKLLMGFLEPAEGKIALFNKLPAECYPRIGYVPQFHRVDRDFPISVEELVSLGNMAAPKAAVHEWLAKLGLYSHRKKKFGELSGGLAQRALLARALVSDPKLLLLDEATSNIDPPSSAAILDLLGTLRGEKTVLLVTHDLKTIVERVDQILCVQGRIQSYRPNEVCEHFALGLYHTPLLELPATHWKQ